MLKLIVLPLAAMLTAAAPSTSVPKAVSNQIVSPEGQQAGDPSRDFKSAPAAEEKKICKQLPTSGSRLPNRACLTAKEWKQIEDEASH